ALGTYATTRPFVDAGKIRLVAVAASQRTASNPNVPTVTESARMPGYDVNAWVAVFAPKATPAATLDKINSALPRALNEPDVRQKMLAMGNDPTPGTRSDFVVLLKADTQKYAELVKATGIKID